MSKSYYCPRCKKQFQKDEQHLMCSSCGFQFSTYRVNKAVHKNAIMKKVKPLIFIGILLVIIGGSYYLITQKSRIGTVCEDGGIIYFDKLFYSNGWRYLEVSPKNISSTSWSETVNEKAVSELKSGLGNGAYNSYNIIYRFGAKSAAYKALNYGKTEDWYLGTRKEMSLLRFISKTGLLKNKIKNAENFSALMGDKKSDNYTRHIYWTSELSDKNYVYVVDFENGKNKLVEYSGSCYVRPIRKF